MNPISSEKIVYTLSKEDYLQHLLYAASKTPSVQKKRKINRLALPILYLAVAVFGFFKENLAMVMAMMGLAFLWYMYFPRWEKKQYLKNYSKYLDQQVQDKVHKEIELEFSNQHILQTEDDTQYLITYDQVRAWHETSSYVYIGLLDNYTIIIPKLFLEEKLEIITDLIQNNTEQIEVPFIRDLSWKWE